MFKSASSHGAASPLGFVALALGCGCFAFNGCPVDDRALGVSGGGTGSASSAGSVGTAGTSRGGVPNSGEGGGGGASEPGEGGAPGAEAGAATQGGASNVAGSATAGNATAGNGNEAGSPNPGGDGCEDLDEDGVRDCEQTVAQNARFMTDLASWEPEPTLHQAWDASDASAIQASGALLVRNTNTAQGTGAMLSGSRQCLPAVGQEAYSVAVKTFIPSGQGGGSAGIAVWFFLADDCVAQSRSAITVQLVSSTDEWLVAHGTFQAPAGTRSMHIRLVTEKPFEQASMEALFDDVLVRQK